MWPEIIIECIELLYWDLYQIDLLIWDKKKERMFIRQWELLKKLWEANIKAETIKDLQEQIKECKKQINEKARESWYWFINDDGVVLSEAELNSHRKHLETELNKYI